MWFTGGPRVIAAMPRVVVFRKPSESDQLGARRGRQHKPCSSRVRVTAAARERPGSLDSAWVQLAYSPRVLFISCSAASQSS
jgi:hypothetical protein